MTVDEQRGAPRRGGFGGGVMLLIGLLVGIALTAAAGVFLLGIGWATPLEAQPVISASPTPSPSPSPTADDSNAEPGAVSDECVRAAEYNLVVEQAVDELAAGAQAQDAKALQETFDKLQDARETADGASEACLAQAGKTPQAGESPQGEESPQPAESPSPEPSPSASPTR